MNTDTEIWDAELVAVTIIHELAHQWLGNLVTTRWWDDIWVTEGLTTLFEDIVLKEVTCVIFHPRLLRHKTQLVNKVAPELDGEVILVVFLQEVMKTDWAVGSNPLNAPIDAYPHVDEKFDSITYAKGVKLLSVRLS